MMNNKVVKNAGWLIAGKVAQSAIGFVISIITARYLGPSNYGLVSYAASLAAFVVPIMHLGFSNVLAHEIINHPEEEAKIVGSTVVLSAISSLFCIVGIISFAAIANAGETDTIIVCALYSIRLLFQAAELIEYWFQAKLLSKYISISSFFAYVIVSLYKIFLLATGKSVHWFAVSNALDAALIAAILFLIYKKLGGRFSFSWRVAKRCFSNGKYYIVSSLMVTIFAQTDKLMIKNMLGDSSTGFYSAAVACATMTSFIFSAIISSMRPIILEYKKADKASKYEQAIKILYGIVIYLSLAQSLVMTVGADLIIRIIYGVNYSASAGALRIVVWYTTFGYIGSVRNIWILAENNQRFLWMINLSGALCNVVLNTILIPVCGIYGAATASLITQIFTNFIMGYILRPLIPNNQLMIKSLNPRIVIDLIRKMR